MKKRRVFRQSDGRHMASGGKRHRFQIKNENSKKDWNFCQGRIEFRRLLYALLAGVLN